VFYCLVVTGVFKGMDSWGCEIPHLKVKKLLQEMKLSIIIKIIQNFMSEHCLFKSRFTISFAFSLTVAIFGNFSFRGMSHLNQHINKPAVFISSGSACSLDQNIDY